ncbi:MAG: phosphoribosylformylglycinamidine synthase subunit PurS [Zetaproteobacteria bacterium]|nr:phosphoribosylformylglycinamidine synthase subunit PurS [Zetaproteobacteria bacterium]
MKLQISVQLKPGILDPEAREIQASLQRLGHTQVDTLTVAKAYVLEFDPKKVSETEAWSCAQQIAAEHLANPVAQNFQIDRVGAAEEEA